MVLLIYFILLFVIYLKSRSVALFLVAIQIVSLTGMFFINLDYEIDTAFKVFNLSFTLIILTLMISPWRKIVNIKHITTTSEKKILKLTWFLLGISIIPFIILSIVSTFVILYVDDINDFKYAEGVSVDFYYNMLPFNIRLLIISNYLYYFSYFLVPLHFYYLYKKKNRLAFFCFLLSLNIVLYGLSFFSRAVFAHYGLLYFCFLIMFYGALSLKIRKNIKKALTVSLILTGIFFVTVTTKRFTEGTMYDTKIPLNSPVQDPVLYSYFDYLSQSYHNGLYVLNSYDYITFNGQLSFHPILSVLARYGFIIYEPINLQDLREEAWPEHYYTFNGFVATSVFDYGYILTLLLSLVYYFYVSKLKPKKSNISILNMFSIALLIQLPMLAIFYSSLGGIMISFLILIGINFYLRTTIKV